MSVNLQQQIRENSRELNDFLKDLNDWTGEVKEKDRSLVTKDATVEIASSSTNNGSSGDACAPPVRGRVDAHRVKSEEDLAADKQSAKKKKKQPSSPSSSAAVKAPEVENSSSSSSKDMGNASFKKGDYVTAISHYTRCIEQEGGACAAYANRAMCGIKLGRWTEAEADCTEALKLEPTYLKAHQRRGITRRELGKYLESTIDFEQALRLEPNSKILVSERNDSKTAYELEARLRPTQARRVVKITVKKREEAEEGDGDDEDDGQTAETVAPATPVGKDVDNLATGSRSTTAAAATTATMKTTTTKEKTEKTASTSSSTPTSSSKKKPAPNINIVAPRTGAEFESLWNRLKIDPGRRMELMRVLSPDAVSSVFKGGVAAPIFSGIIRLCLEGCVSNTLSTAVSILTALTSVPRFDMAVMFITGSARKELQSLWDEAAAASSSEREDLVLLRKKYKL